jgi:hypothetical protein
MPEKKKYTVKECVLAIRSDPNSPSGLKDEQVFQIFLGTEINSEEDIETLIKEMIFHRKDLLDRFCEEISKKR